LKKLSNSLHWAIISPSSEIAVVRSEKKLKISQYGQISPLIGLGILSIALPAIAGEPSQLTESQILEQIEEYNSQNDSLDQINNISQLKDVSPSD
jgi:hypothetical protein